MQFCWNVRLISQKHIGIQSLFCLVLMATLLFSKLSVASTVDEVAQLRQIAQLAEYVGVDYASAVENGQVINNDEYQEMLEFSAFIVDKTSSNNYVMHYLNEKASSLQTAILTKQKVDIVRQFTSELRISLLALMPELPSLKDYCLKRQRFLYLKIIVRVVMVFQVKEMVFWHRD